jgi:hypothetical protein
MPTVEDLRIISEGLTEKLGRLPTITEIAKELDGNLSTNFARVQKILTEGTDYAKPLTKLEAARLGGRPIPNHVVMADDIEGLEKLKKKISKLNRVNKLSDKAIEFKIYKTQGGNFTPALLYTIGNKREFGPIEELKKQLNKYKKTNEFQAYSKNEAMLGAGKKSALKQIDPNKLKIFNYLLLNEKASLADLSKDLNIKTSQAKSLLQSLYTDIYKRIGDQGAVALKQFNNSELETVHDAIKNTGVRLKDRVKNLVTDAYKGDKNLKPLLEKLDNFYTQMAEVKKQPFGKYFVGNLDHPVPLTFIRQLKEGADPMNLIKIKPIPEFLNQRAFKAQFDKVLGQAYKKGNKKALEAIVNLQSYLPQEFGGITTDGRIKDYGAEPFNLKTNLSVAKFPEIYKKVFEFIKNPELQSTFKESGVSFKSLASQEKIITKMADNFLKYRADVLADAARGGAVCQIFRKAGGRIGFANGGTGCVVEVEEALKRNPQKFAQDMNKTEGVASKIKNKGAQFLTALKENPNILRGSLGSKIALGLGTVAAGAGAGALVKQFRNDDPSTYLTNDSQMEGMIISDVEDKGKEVDDNILLDNQFKLELAGAAGLTAPIAKGVYQTARGVGETGPLPEGVGRTRAALGLSKGVLGKGLWALGAPIVALPSTVGYVAQDIRAGKDAEEIATNPLNYLGAAFMNPAVKALGRAGASRGLLGIASLGLAGTAAAPLLAPLSIGAGLAALGTLGYQGYKAVTGKNRSDEDFFR